NAVKTQVVENEVELRQLGEDVAKATAAFEQGGKPDFEREQRRCAIALGISDDGIAERWRQAKQNWHRMCLRKLFGKAEVKPDPGAETQEKSKGDDGPSKIGEAQKVFAEAQPKADADDDWERLAIPPQATELERLTYVPGIVGELQDWIVRTAIRPNR